MKGSFIRERKMGRANLSMEMAHIMKATSKVILYKDKENS
jgi:hypothetical protein